MPLLLEIQQLAKITHKIASFTCDENHHVWSKRLRPEPSLVCSVGDIINQVVDWPLQLFPREVVVVVAWGVGVWGGDSRSVPFS